LGTASTKHSVGPVYNPIYIEELRKLLPKKDNFSIQKQNGISSRKRKIDKSVEAEGLKAIHDSFPMVYISLLKIEYFSFKLD
jgi:hypothetical protein